MIRPAFLLAWALSACALAAPPDGWIPLFDGRTLNGWHVSARPEDRAKNFWKAGNGTIVCDSRGRKDHDYVWLVSDGEYGDFELQLKVRSFRDSPGNAGIQVRSRYDDAALWLDGPQVDIHPPGPWRTGLIYDETRETKRWVFPSLKDWNIEPSQGPAKWAWKHSDEGDGWNTIQIVCRGTRIRTTVNGLPIADFDGAGILDDAAHRSHNVGLRGHIALQLHMKDDLYIEYKDILVRETGAGLRSEFVEPPPDSRIMMRWWWFGPSVKKPELEREMRLMRSAGIGGFEVQPVYPLQLDGNLRYLSGEFIDALRFTAEKARELGLRMDLTVGSGWPYGGPAIPITQAAGRLRCDRATVAADARELPLPQIGEGEQFLAAFLVKGDGRSSLAEARPLEVRAGAALLPERGEGPHTALFFLSSRTKQAVKRAAFGAEGYVLDHYDRAALDTHLKNVGDRLFEAFRGITPPHAVFCDSLEVYGSDWTPDFLDEFRKRRGYDLKPYLPALAGDIGPKTGAIRNDWVRTLGELAEERFLSPLESWAKAHGTLLRVQDYGIPPVTLASNALVDLPEGEGSFWNRFTTSRWASSAGHVLGRPVISSETWTWLHSPAFRATPLDMKAEADRHFLEGINQLIGHGWPYSPPEAGKPGWRFYAAAVFDDSNPWWLVMPDLAGYMQRVSYVLRQGRPVNDVALYLPTADARAQTPPGRASINEQVARLLPRDLIAKVLEAGFGLDFIDDGLIGRLDKRYSVVILPGVERIPLDTYRKLEAFVRGGGVLIATGKTPSLAPGLVEAETDTPQIAATSRRLFSGGPGHVVADAESLRTKLASLRTPDVAMSPAAPEVGFVHRTSPEYEIYFVANTGNTAQRTRAAFRAAGLEAEWWDPYTGRMTRAAAEKGPDGRPVIALDLEPYGSRVLVFSKRAQAEAPAIAVNAGPPVTVDISAGWTVTFDGLKRTTQFEKLRSWTDDPETRFYSGTATYTKTITITKAMLEPKLALWLDFGRGAALPEVTQKQPGMRAWFESPVREAAVVYVNGKRAGSVWHPPYRVEIGGLAHAGENEVRIVAGNLAINALAGSPPPDYGPLYARYGQRFAPQDMDNLKPLPAGILGPVRLLSEPIY